MKTYGKYVKWPLGVSGNHHIVNIQAEEDCVHLSLMATFCYEDALKLHNLSQQSRFSNSKVGEYFTFPENISKPV